MKPLSKVTAAVDIAVARERLATAMLAMTTLFVDATDPSAPIRTYAGYTDAELSGGKPCVSVR